MSLRVWLSGDYKNRGSADVSVTNNGTTLDSDRNSYVFNGSNSYINLGKIESLFDATPFSITFWIYSNKNGTRGIIFGAYGITSTSSFLNIEINNSSSTNNYLRFDWKGPDKGFGSVFIPYQQWSHIAITYDGVSSLKVYQNGVLKENVTTTLETIGNNSDYYVGKDSRNGTTAFDGKLADFRIYDEAISPELIRHLSRQPHEKELKVWLPLNGDLRNQGTADVTVTNNGATVDNSGKMGKCYYLNANKLSFTNPKVGDWNKFTVCGWVKLADGYTANNGFHLFIFGATYYRICISKDGAAVRALLSDGSTNSGVSSTMLASALSASVWNHYAVSFDNGKVSIYINGVLDNSYTVSFTSVRFVNATLDIGTYSSETCKGSINDFRLYSYALSPEEIKKISQGLALHYRLSGIGGENLIPHSNVSTSDMNALWNTYSNTMEVVTEDDITCYHFKTTASSSGINTGKVRSVYLQPNTTYTFSYWIKSSVASDFKFSKIGHFQVYNSNSTATDKAHEDVVSQRHYSTSTLTANKWTKVWVTFTTNDMTGSDFILYIWYLEPNADYWAYGFKLEEGSAATPWLPNTTDSEYSTMGLNNNIEYDISGFNNNGTKSPVVIINTDSPRYETSYGTSSNSYFVNGGKISNILCQETPEYTVNLWCYKDDWTDNASELFSCAEGGGFAFDTTTSGFRAWSNVYTNADKSSYGYIAYTQTHAISSGWHMFTLVDDLTGTKAYIDGELIRTAASTNYGLHLNVNANLYIGAESTGSSYTSPYLNGRVSDFRIYATALSASDVQALYELGEV